ncbi:2635_t:CDS:2, partial [Paraglomus occultum]
MSISQVPTGPITEEIIYRIQVSRKSYGKICTNDIGFADLPMRNCPATTDIECDEQSRTTHSVYLDCSTRDCISFPPPPCQTEHVEIRPIGHPLLERGPHKRP